MPLKKIPVAPGFDKQDTASQAEGRWIDGDNVRFRYGSPEKIGGWQQLLSDTLVGSARNQLIWSDLKGNRYAAIGTNKVLVIYFEGQFYDITPLDTALTSCTFTSTTGSTTVTVNKANHGLDIGRLVKFTAVTLPGAPSTGYVTADFTTNLFEVQTTPSSDTFTITMLTAETGTGMTAAGSATCSPYYYFGPFGQTYGYGYGTANWGGFSSTVTQNQLNGAINDSVTTITVDSTTNFPASGTILIDSELITYASKNSTQFLTCVRGVSGTAAASHSDNKKVYDAATFVGWGQSSSVQTPIRLDPANWSLDIFGQILIATMHNGPTFTWDPSAANALETRAVINASMPTKSVMSIVSDRDRHVIFLGTETTIGVSNTQDKMFIRFSDQEDYNVYAPTSTNTAGTFRLDDGTKIVGAVKAKDYILILTDNAAYQMRFVGPPYTFSINKVGSNCGCLGQQSIVFANGAVWWMGDSGGFFVFDGTVTSVPSLVEDFVFTTTGDDNLGLNYNADEIVYAAHNSLYQEIMWFYAQASSSNIDRVVTLNYGDPRNLLWTTGTLARTTWYDASVYDNPNATKYDENAVPTFPVVNGVSNGASIYYQQETGYNETDAAGAKTAIPAYVRSGDFDLDVDGDGQYFLKLNRFIPDFKNLEGNAKVTLFLRSYPADTTTLKGQTTIGPFTINSSTDKIDTRGRARLASIKIENDAVDETWRYGIFRIDIQPDGRR
jgi:hypothetical protein